jgi:hypothetical protein
MGKVLDLLKEAYQIENMNKGEEYHYNTAVKIKEAIAVLDELNISLEQEYIKGYQQGADDTFKLMEIRDKRGLL